MTERALPTAAANGTSTTTETSPPISALIFTLDEEPNLQRCLDSLRWCDDVIVVDSFSHDRTQAIARDAGARVVQRAFTSMYDQRNWALLSAGAKHEWALILDADERVPPELAGEMARVARDAPQEVAAYRVRRRFHLWGRWLEHSSLYPTWVVRLMRRDRARFVRLGHGEIHELDGELGALEHDLIDENAKGVVDWFDRQNRYARREAQYELDQESMSLGAEGLFSSDPVVRRKALKSFVARMPGRAGAYFAYSYLLRRGFLDGADGLVFCGMRAMFQQMVSVHKYDLRRGRDGR